MSRTPAMLMRSAIAAIVLAASLTIAATPAQAAVPVVQISLVGRAAGTGCSHPNPAYGEVWIDPSWSSLSVGMIHLWDCSYAKGNYDVALRADGSTYELGWDEAAGVFIGSGYCAQLYYWDQDDHPGWARYSLAGDVKGPVQAMFVDGGTQRVVQYIC